MNILTFDLEDWFHLLEHEDTKSPEQWNHFPSRLEYNTEVILNLLQDHNAHATFFVLGWIAEKFPQIVKKIQSCGHHLACHGYSHQLIHQQSQKQFKEDIHKAIGIIENIATQKITCYRAPGFSLTEKTPWAFNILADEGILIDSSIVTASRAHGGHKSIPILKPSKICFDSREIHEFPILPTRFLNTSLIYSGGGYFRLLPLALILSLFKSTNYNMTYFHPRDFDPEQPLLPNLGPLRYFKSYYGLKSSKSKLEHLLEHLPFCTLNEAHDQINWDTSSSLSLNPNGTFEIQNSSPLTL